MDTHENQRGLNADTPERALDDAAESLPEEELLYDLADLFKVFSDTTRIKILYALMNDERASTRSPRTSEPRNRPSPTSCASSSRHTWSNSVATAATSTTRSPTTTS